MGIINEDKSNQLFIDNEVSSIKSITTNIYRTLKHQHTIAFNKVWDNPNFTPQEIIDAFGSDAASLFSISWSIQQILLAADPNYKLLIPPMNVTLNSDGTVTLS